MDNKNNRETVVCFRLDGRETRVLKRLMNTEERPGVASVHKYARAVLVEYLSTVGKKSALLAA